MRVARVYDDSAAGAVVKELRRRQRPRARLDIEEVMPLAVEDGVEDEVPGGWPSVTSATNSSSPIGAHA